MKRNLYLTIISCLISLYQPISNAKEIAITIDDLPFVGGNNNDAGNMRRLHDRFMNILNSLNENHVPATGFIIAGAIGKGQWELLETFRNNGYELGNHTYSHANLNRLSAEQYIAEIGRADAILTPVMTTPKYFRYPYLAEGKGEKKAEVQDYLNKQQYTIAPVTIDSKDYMFNERLLHIPWRVRSQHLNEIKRQYLNFIWNQTVKAEKRAHYTKQILLIHANLLNSLFLSDVIKMYKDHGYNFIKLDEAIAAAPNESTYPNNNLVDEDYAWVTQI